MNDLFLRACRRESVERTPIWLMRQAGRYLPGYRAIREKVDFVTLSRTPSLVAEVTIEPVLRFQMDAAILFADILTPLIGNGVHVSFEPGPVLERPFRSGDDLTRLTNFVPMAAVPETLSAVTLLKRELDVPLIGFAGGPFTLACYLVDGKGTKDFAATRSMLYRDPGLFGDLLFLLAEMVGAYACAQVRAGAAAIQIFDTWAALLGPREFREHLAPTLSRIAERIRGLGVPVVYYVNGAAAILDEIGRLPFDVAGIDWRIPLDRAREALPETMALQGNLDPMVLLGPARTIRERARDVLMRAAGRAHVFNLGHGIHRSTPPENVDVLVDAVREAPSPPPPTTSGSRR